MHTIIAILLFNSMDADYFSSVCPISNDANDPFKFGYRIENVNQRIYMKTFLLFSGGWCLGILPWIY